jgi:predicted RNase H-like HicB family nuclease
MPDLPGCIAVAEIRRGAVRHIRKGIALHVQALRDRGLPVPKPPSTSEVVDVRTIQQRVSWTQCLAP